MSNMKKIFALLSGLTIIALSVFVSLFSKNPAGINYSPNTGDSKMIIFVVLVIVAVALLIFVRMRRKK